MRTTRTSRSGGSTTGGGSARRGRTGIWHETFLVRAGEYEAIYGNMPPTGLAQAGRLVPIGEGSTARLRIRAREAS